MSLAEKPHTVTLEIPECPTLPEGFAGAPWSVGEVSLRCQITPKTPAAALNGYGVALTRPHKLMADIEDEVWLNYHDARVRQVANGIERIFYIASAVRYHGQGDDCDHISVMLEMDKPTNG